MFNNINDWYFSISFFFKRYIKFKKDRKIFNFNKNTQDIYDKNYIKNKIAEQSIRNDVYDIERAYKYRDILFDISIFTQFTTTISTAGIMLSNILNTHSGGTKNKFTIGVSGIFIFSSGINYFINHLDRQFNQQQINILKKYDMYNDKYIDQNVEIYDAKERMDKLNQNNIEK